ncbi:MAG: hypothetical protein VB111_05530 [Clostridiaceae bacterium]|nr:hypothetical protein [Clostridiaceae bacterium]
MAVGRGGACRAGDGRLGGLREGTRTVEQAGDAGGKLAGIPADAFPEGAEGVGGDEVCASSLG